MTPETTFFFLLAGVQRRVYAIVEMVSMLYRCLLPVPVWLGYYSKDGDYFAAIYLVLKVRRLPLKS